MSHLEARKQSRSERSTQQQQRRAVLSEEEYTSTLEGIVQRDYFPELLSLQRQAAVLQKRAVGDVAGAVAVRRAARQLESHEQALKEQETEDEQAVDGDSRLRKTPRPLHRETVSGFHARATSEDNAEFDQTQRKEVQSNRQQLQTVFQNGSDSPRIAGRASVSETPLLASDQFNAPLNKLEWKDSSQDRSSLFFTPRRDDLATLEEQQEKKPLLIVGDYQNDNAAAALMPPPAPVQTKQHSSSSIVVARTQKAVPKQYLVEYVPKHMTEKRIEPAQTRFPSTAVVTAPQRGHLEGDDQSCTTEYSTDDTAAATDLDEPTMTITQERTARSKRQRRDQETLVAMTPLLVPGKTDRNADSASPIVTWGTVASTPLVIGGMDTSSEKAFCFPKESHREEAARLAEVKMEKAKQRKRKRKLRTTTPVDPRTATLTPAARSLFEKNMVGINSPGVRSRGAFASALRSSYTPQIKRGNDHVSLVKRDHALKATPKSTRRPDDVDESVEKKSLSNGNITDGLLRLAGK